MSHLRTGDSDNGTGSASQYRTAHHIAVLRVHIFNRIEIQQTSDITYRIYDFNRKDANGKTRELHTDLAREAINYEVLDDYRTKYEPLKDEPVELVACPYFTTSLYDMTEEISCDYSELDSFVIFICMEGSCTMRDNEGNELTVSAGESILLPATTQDVTITPEGGSVKLLETYV